jgi:hypothetical protein
MLTFKRMSGDISAQIAALANIVLEQQAQIQRFNDTMQQFREEFRPLISELNFKRSSMILREDELWINAVMSWLDGRSFELLYRASRDGWTSGDFHRFCDNRGPTLVVVRSSNGFVFGGYAAAAWNTNGAYFQSSGNASFVFTLKNPHNIPPTRYNCKNANAELFGNESFGPVFGGGHDLRVANNSNAGDESWCNLGLGFNDTNGHGTATFTGKQKFQVGEYEVFAVK